MSNMDEELNQESNSSKETDSSTQEEETRHQTEAQQGTATTDEQLTLHALHSLTKRDSEAMEDENGILVHGPSCLGPRPSLYIIDNPPKSVVKVSQSQGVPERNKSAFQNCCDQLT